MYVLVIGRNYPIDKNPLINGVFDNVSKLEELYDKYNSDCRKWNKAICYFGGRRVFTYESGIAHLIKAAYKTNVKLILARRFFL